MEKPTGKTIIFYVENRNLLWINPSFYDIVESMGRTMRVFPDGTKLEYDRGKFDDFCLYIVESDGKRHSPQDIEYFSDLKNLSDEYGVEVVYEDFVSVYDHTTKDFDKKVYDIIDNISEHYPKDELRVKKLFSIFYLTMISEENKYRTKLGKRVKRLGVHYLLKENQKVSLSTTFMIGVPWRDLDELCKERGF